MQTGLPSATSGHINPVCFELVNFMNMNIFGSEPEQFFELRGVRFSLNSCLVSSRRLLATVGSPLLLLCGCLRSYLDGVFLLLCSIDF